MEKTTSKLIESKFSPLNERVSSTLNGFMFNMLNMSDLQSRFGAAKEGWEQKQKTAFRQTDLVKFISQRHKVSKATVSLWLNGPTQNISYDNAVAAAEFFGVDVEWLRTGKGRPYTAIHHPETGTPTPPRDANEVLMAYTAEISENDMRKQIVNLFNQLSRPHKETLVLLAKKLHSIENK